MGISDWGRFWGPEVHGALLMSFLGFCPGCNLAGGSVQGREDSPMSADELLTLHVQGDGGLGMPGGAGGVADVLA